VIIVANRNRTLVPEAKSALERFKLEVADEVGIPDYDHVDKGQLSSRENGMVGGLMVKHMIEAYERELSGR
jgi:Small, acid-soluble spore proteins, alpha/beta type.